MEGYFIAFKFLLSVNLVSFLTMIPKEDVRDLKVLKNTLPPY